MKTKELIKQLQAADPSGELECAIDGNVDIFTIFVEAAYWDGSLQVLERDHSKDPYYNICGGKFIREGWKVSIKPLSIEDALMDDINMPIKLVGYGPESRKQMEGQIESWRNEAKEIIEEVRQMSKKRKKK